MKKWNRIVLSLAVVLTLLSGCGGVGTGKSGIVGAGTDESGTSGGETVSAEMEALEIGAEETSVPEGTLHIVATTFPIWDWTRQILGDRDAVLTLLLDNSVDMHSFQPTVDDMVTVSTCDLFLYVGGESDKWTADALIETVNPNQRSVSLLDALGGAAVEEETVEGMQAEDDSGEESGDAEEEGPEYDEHVWLSLKNAGTLCGVIADALCELDPAGAETYRVNLAAYQAELSDLDRRYQETVDAAPVHTLLFGDRFPFRYLTEDYGLDYYAAFSGCSAETEASFETIVFLSGKVDELDLPAVLTIETGDGKIARTIVENTAAKSAEILAMDSMQSASYQKIDDGWTYLKAMDSNLAVLGTALGLGGAD